MAALLKALEYAGVILLLGAGVFRFFIAPGVREGRLVRLSVGTGALVLAVSSLAGLLWRLYVVLGRFDPALSLEYLLSTNGGRLVLLRLGLVLVTLLALRLGWRTVFTLAALGILYSFSASSHAAAMHGNPALVADLGHFLAAALWGGSVLYTALNWDNLGEGRLPSLERVSRVGLGSVILLALTGVYASTLHLASPDLLVSSPYGRVLSLKLAVVTLILALAALNRWHFLPRLRASPHTHARFGRILQLEAFLLFAVFALTGLLTTSPLPHD